MRLAEALLRVPDAETAIALTADQLGRADFAGDADGDSPHRLLAALSSSAIGLAKRWLPEVGEPPPVDLHPARGRPQQAGQMPEQGGLAGPGRAEQRDHLPGPDGQVHPAQRGHLGAGCPVDVYQVVAADRERRGRGRRGASGYGPGHGSASRSRSGRTERTSSRLAATAASTSTASAAATSRARPPMGGR